MCCAGELAAGRQHPVCCTGKPWEFRNLATAAPCHWVPCPVPSPTQAGRISAQLQCLFPDPPIPLDHASQGTHPIPSPTQAGRISAQLQCLFPDPPIPLDHASPFQLLTAVMLSAQVRGQEVGGDKGRGPQVGIRGRRWGAEACRQAHFPARYKGGGHRWGAGHAGGGPEVVRIGLLRRKAQVRSPCTMACGRSRAACHVCCMSTVVSA